MDYGRESGLDQFDIDLGSWFTCYPGRPDYFAHRGPPQAQLPPDAKTQHESAYRRLGLIDQ